VSLPFSREKDSGLRHPIDAPVELVIGTIFLYSLLGVSCLFGLLVTCLFIPLNHFAGKVIVNAQDNLMKTRDERVSLMNEILGGIRMLKFMAWERSFESRVHKVRRKELKYQRRNYHIEVNHLTGVRGIGALTLPFRYFSTPFGVHLPFS
jgi:ABC-type bacteriocin/lantibiotic exporter with double-glycine peptidase domain